MREDEATTILRQIRDEIVTTRTDLGARIDGVSESLGARIDAVNESLGARIDVTNERLAVVETTLQELAGQQVMLTRYVGNMVTRHDTEIDELRDRVTRLEVKVG
jgi:uncharacterized protein YPO0396